MSDKDLIIAKTNKGIELVVESKEAKVNFLNNLKNMVEKSDLIKEKGYTCGNCAVYPCFRMPYEKDRAGLCYQEVKSCRDECDDFLKNKDSGKSPDFKITGNCRIDNNISNYGQPCRFLK